MSTRLVSICLCTFKRPSVIDTIAGLSTQNLPVGIAIEVIVIDSDLNRSAKKNIETAKSNFNLDIKDYVADKPGISSARNKAVKEANGEWLLFIDDDEVPEPNWVRELLSCANKFSSTVVFGEVKTTYPLGTPNWIVEANLFGKKLSPTGTIVSHGPTSNALVLRELVEKQPYIFNESFGATGGEDTDFFYRLYKSGAKMITCKEAIVSETVEQHRLNKKFLIKKALRTGETYFRIFLLERGSLIRAFYLVRAGLQVLLCLFVSFLFYPFNFGMHVKFMILAASNLGKIRAAVGAKQVELYKG